jgi:Mn2+/Fe2+ NRAMP family transporter
MRRGARGVRSVGLRQRVLTYLAILGPGMITANAGNDAGGIATFASVGAEFGYQLLWILIPITISLGIVQEMCARMGAVTGKGLADLIRERFGVRWTCTSDALVADSERRSHGFRICRHCRCL